MENVMNTHSQNIITNSSTMYLLLRLMVSNETAICGLILNYQHLDKQFFINYTTVTIQIRGNVSN